MQLHQSAARCSRVQTRNISRSNSTSLLRRGPNQVSTSTSRRASSIVRAASPDSRQETRRPSAMPQLPERKPKAPPTKPTSSSPHRPKPSLPPPEQFQQQAQERTLAGLLAYAGLLGTFATAASFVLPDVDLFGNFNLDSPADIALGLELLLPACLLNLAIMLPDYSSWKVPTGEPTLEAQQSMAEALLSWTAKQKAAKAAGAAGAAPGSNGASSNAPAGDAAASPSASHASSSSSSESLSQEASTSTTTASSSSATSSATNSQALPEPVVSPPWLISNPDPPLPLPLARCKDALLMAQGHYLSSTPRIALPWQTQAVVLLVNCMAAELLYRSVLLQVSGGWLTDRILEAGAEDWFLSAAAHLPVLPTPHMTGQLAAVALLSGAWGVAVVRQVVRMSRRPSLVMASQGRVASGKLYADMQQLTGADSSSKRQEGAADKEQQDSSAMQATSSDNNSNAASTSSSTTTSSSKPSASHEAAKYAEAAAAEGATAAPSGTNPSTNSSSSDSSKRLTSRRGLSAQLPNALGALALSQIVTGVRDLTQSAGLGLAFALTGNLAAPFVAAVVTEGLMAVLQQRGQERSRQRSIAFAKHFASFTRVFRDVQRKQQLKDQEDQQQLPAGQQQPQPQTSSPDTQDSLPLVAAAAAVASSDSGGSAGADDADGVLDAAAAAAAGVAAGDAVAVLHAAASQETAGAVAGPGVVTSGVGGSRIKRTISVLDQLLGEQLAAADARAAAAAGPHSSK